MVELLLKPRVGGLSGLGAVTGDGCGQRVVVIFRTGAAYSTPHDLFRDRGFSRGVCCGVWYG